MDVPLKTAVIVGSKGAGPACPRRIQLLANMVGSTIYVLYAVYRYDWAPLKTGVARMTAGFLAAVVQTLIVKPAIRYLGERGMMIAGAVAFFIYGIAPNGMIFFCAQREVS